METNHDKTYGNNNSTETNEKGTGFMVYMAMFIGFILVMISLSYLAKWLMK